MKRIISTILICVLLLGAMLVLASCGGKIDKGEYVGSNGSTVEIEGKELVISKDGVIAEFTYEIKVDEDDSDKQRIYITDSDGEVVDYYFEKLDDGFQFNGVKYTKK